MRPRALLRAYSLAIFAFFIIIFVLDNVTKPCPDNFLFLEFKKKYVKILKQNIKFL